MPAKIPTEVFRLPANAVRRTTGSFTNSGRVIQWHWKAADGPGEIARRPRHHGRCYSLKLKEMYAKDGGKLPDAIMD
jgi:hypothetical protein